VIQQLMGSELVQRLKNAGIAITVQRMALAQLLLERPCHVTAEQLLERARAVMPELSRATVYNTLRLFADKGLVRELSMGGDSLVFDSSTAPHYHYFNVDTGEVTDIPSDSVQVLGLPPLPEDMELHEVEVIVKVRARS